LQGCTELETGAVLVANDLAFFHEDDFLGDIRCEIPYTLKVR
jgi:hypothetical protein